MATPAAPGTGGTPNPMNVSLGNIRQVEIHHMADAVDVDAPCGDIGLDWRAHTALAKGVQHPIALVLRLVSSDCFSSNAGIAETAHHFVSTVLGAGQHNRAIDRLV